MKYLLSIILLTVQIFAQSQILKSTGELINLKSKNSSFEELQTDSQVAGVLDTLSYKSNVDFNVQLGMGKQDVLAQWFIAPADMIIKALGFRCSHAGPPLKFKLVKLDWDYSIAEEIFHPKYIGYYPSAGDGANNAGAFPDEATGEWVDKTYSQYSNPFSSNNWLYWDDGGLMEDFVPEEREMSDLNYQFISSGVAGYEPEIAKGEVIGIVIKSESEDTTRFWAKEQSSQYNEIPGWKYYEYGKESTDEPGWWATDYVFDFALVIGIITDTGIFIRYVTEIQTTTSTEAHEVCCSVYSIGLNSRSSKLEKVELVYTVNNGSEVIVVMDSVGNDNYCGEIPGQQPGDEILYYVVATDINGEHGSSNPFTYKIFDPKADLLLIMNGRQDLLKHYYMRYFKNPYDEWFYAELPDELLQNYKSVIQIESAEEGPIYDNREVISKWLRTGNKNYLQVGQETLGAWNDYQDSVFLPGDFEYDFLGVAQSINDVSFNPDIDTSFFNPSLLQFVEGTVLGDSIASMQSDSIWYDPRETFGQTTSNWLDQFIPREDIMSEVFVKGFDWSITKAKPVGHNFIDNKNNKIVFMAFDPLSLHSDTIWVGEKSISPFAQALKWFEVSVDVGEKEVIRAKFYLAQNYPNPFNPTTKIKFTIPNVETPYKASLQTKLIIFDILGKEIKTIINKPLQPGEYEVEFDGTNLPSGVYFYRIVSGNFISTKKMLLLK